MNSTRLTKIQKAEILEAYKAGDNTNSLAEKYRCTSNTINRTVKTLLTENEYALLKEKRLKISNKKRKRFNNQSVNKKKEDLAISLDREVDNLEVNQIVSFLPDNADSFSKDIISKYKDNEDKEIEKNNQNTDNNLDLIEPLITDFDFDQNKRQLDFQILDYESLPKSVYMIVDKKVELDLKLISDLPEWNFLPENELKRNAILLFDNQRSAKRSCLRNQRVIKIPNTSVFEISKSYLISRGITRLIFEESIIALDN